jgi:hypothetical protein
MFGRIVAEGAYLDLLAHVGGSIRTDAGVDGTDLSYHKGQTHARPATAVGELREDNRGGIARCQNPEHDDNLS